jgi:hypothetical protein
VTEQKGTIHVPQDKTSAKDDAQFWSIVGKLEIDNDLAEPTTPDLQKTDWASLADRLIQKSIDHFMRSFWRQAKVYFRWMLAVIVLVTMAVLLLQFQSSVPQTEAGVQPVPVATVQSQPADAQSAVSTVPTLTTVVEPLVPPEPIIVVTESAAEAEAASPQPMLDPDGQVIPDRPTITYDGNVVEGLPPVETVTVDPDAITHVEAKPEDDPVPTTEPVLRLQPDTSPGGPGGVAPALQATEISEPELNPQVAVPVEAPSCWFWIFCPHVVFGGGSANPAFNVGWSG